MSGPNGSEQVPAASSNPGTGSAVPPARPKRWLRRLGLLAAGLLAALLGVSLVPLWLRHRADEEARAQAAAIERTLDSPGTLLLDPALPTGVLVVTLVPAATGFDLTQPAIIRVDNRTFAWTPEARGRFHGLVEAHPYPLTVVGPYAVEPVSVTLPSGASGARIALRAIPLDPLQVFGVDIDPYATPEKRLEVDMTRPDLLELRWIQGTTVISIVEMPRAATVSPSGRPSYPALAGRVEAEWKMQGGHRDPSDRRFDRAIVRAQPWTPFDELSAVTSAILAVTRETARDGERRTVPAFSVSVQPPPPPPPPASPYLAEPAPEPRAAGPKVEMGKLSVSGRLPPAVIERILRQRIGRVRQCYEAGLRANPTLAGRVAVRFVIGADGATSRETNGGSDLPDASTTQCIIRATYGLSFPQPEGGLVTVVVPYLLSSGSVRH